MLDSARTGLGNVPPVLFGSVYDSIREDPRFRDYLAALGLTEAHTRAQAWRAAHPAETPRSRK